MVSTLWNRWPTARRSQRRATQEYRCQLGCPGKAENSIEPDSHCAVLHGFASRRLNFHVSGGFLSFWCLVQGSDPGTRTKATLMAYISYRATNAARRIGGTTSEYASQMLGQLLYDAVRDHREAAAVVSGSFIRRPRTTQAGGAATPLRQRRHAGVNQSATAAQAGRSESHRRRSAAFSADFSCDFVVAPSGAAMAPATLTGR